MQYKSLRMIKLCDIQGGFSNYLMTLGVLSETSVMNT